MPLDPPVITATFPSSFPMIFPLIDVCDLQYDKVLRRQFSAASDSREAAVHCEVHAIHVARISGSEKERCCGNLLRATHLSTRDQRLEHLSRPQFEPLRARRVDLPRAQH